MKAKVVPILFPDQKNEGRFADQLQLVKEMFADEAEFLDPAQLEGELPEADAAVLFSLPPKTVYHKVELLKKVSLPMIVISSEYGARSMWDWENFTYLRAEGVNVYSPYTQELTRILLRTVAFKRQMKSSKLLIWMSDPHQGFYFFDRQSAERIHDTFGVTVEFASYKDVCERARQIPDEDARREAKERVVLKEDVRGSRLLNAYKLYMAMREQIDATPGVIGVGCACLDEPYYTTTTPCLAWNLLNRERGLAVVCEGDIISLMTECIVENTIGKGTFSTNIYPFLMGLAAIRHEKISHFPPVDSPDDHALLVHCGYCGMIPEKMASSWVLRPSVLGMVNEDAVMVDARIAEGDITLVKLHSSFDRWFLSPAELEGYAQYPGSDCRNGGVIRLKDGYEFMNGVYSHHITVLPGRYVAYLKFVGELLGLKPDEH